MSVYLSMGYDERDASAYSVEITLPDDTRPGQIAPIPVAGPSFAPKIRQSSDRDFVLSAVTVYYNTMRLTA